VNLFTFGKQSTLSVAFFELFILVLQFDTQSSNLTLKISMDKNMIGLSLTTYLIGQNPFHSLYADQD